jgi:hypothetical protein
MKITAVTKISNSGLAKFMAAFYPQYEYFSKYAN